MDRYDKLLAVGREMEEQQRQAVLRELLQDPRCAALVVMVRGLWEEFALNVGRQDLAAHQGNIQHCAGSLHGLRVVEDILRHACGAKKGDE